MENPELMTIREVGDYLRVSRASVYKLLKAGQLQRIKVSTNATRIPRTSLDEFIARSAA